MGVFDRGVGDPGQFAGDAADLGNSPLSITEIPQLIAGVGCR